MPFTQLDLQPSILHALGKIGYDHMTPIQEVAIPLILDGQDVVGLAETGSGKTGTLRPLRHRHNSPMVTSS